MRKLLALLLLTALLLTGCANTAAPGEYEAGGVSLTVNHEFSRVTDGQHVYNFTREDIGDGEKIVITYPNGVQYYRTNDRAMVAEGLIGGLEDTDISGYIDPDILFDAICDQRSGGGFSMEKLPVFLLGAAFLIFGIFSIGNAEGAWRANIGWQFKDAEPSDLALSMTTVGGVVLLLVGIVMIVAAFFI